MRENTVAAEPQTEAGRALLDGLRAEYDQGHMQPWQDRIAAIEAEAAAATRNATARRDSLREAAVTAYEAMNAACVWSATQAAHLRTVEEADEHVEGYDALVMETARLGIALGLLRGDIAIDGAGLRAAANADGCPTCGRPTFRDQFNGRRQARRCGGCNLVVGRCQCAPGSDEGEHRGR